MGIFSEKYLRKLVGKTEIEGALKRLDKLTQEEARMATAQVLKATHTVDGSVRGVTDEVVGVDNRAADVDSRVAGYDTGFDTKVADVDARVVGYDTGYDTDVAGVDARAAGVDNRVADVDDRVKTVDGNVAAAIDGLHHIFDRSLNLFNPMCIDGKETRVDIQQTATDVDQVEHLSSPNRVDARYTSSITHTGNHLRQNLRRWLSPPDPSTNHNIARRAHHEGTATWLFQGSIYNEWKSTPSLLWVHGKRAPLSHFLPDFA